MAKKIYKNICDTITVRIYADFMPLFYYYNHIHFLLLTRSRKLVVDFRPNK